MILLYVMPISQIKALKLRERVSPSLIWDANEDCLVPVATLVSFRVIGGFQPWMWATITWRPLITDNLDPTPRDPDLICLPCGPGMEFLKAPQVILRRNQGRGPLNDVIHEAGPGGKVATLRYKLRFI